jgi:hypothetical protein
MPHSRYNLLGNLSGHFDVIAVQEVWASALAFLAMMQLLGPDWGYRVTDVTEGRGGGCREARPHGVTCSFADFGDRA